MKKLPIYKISIDDMYAENGEDLGIEQIAFTSNPAIKIKGLAFSMTEPKSMIFKDDLKYRIAGPIMVPGNIYRCDDSEYYVQFTAEEIEKIHKKYMASPKKEIFNLEHTDEIVPAYPIEIMLVDSEIKQAMIKDEYGIEVPMGSSFMVSQVTNKDYYAQLIANDQVGFSIEGFLGLALNINNNNQIKQNEMNKQEFKLQDGSTLEVYEDGSTNVVKIELADVTKPEDEQSGDTKQKSGDSTTPAPSTPSTPPDVATTLPSNMAEGDVAPNEAPAVDTSTVDYYSKEEVDAKFSELYDIIAELKAKDEIEDVAEDAADAGVPIAMSIHERFKAYLNFAKETE